MQAFIVRNEALCVELFVNTPWLEAAFASVHQTPEGVLKATPFTNHGDADVCLSPVHEV